MTKKAKAVLTEALTFSAKDRLHLAAELLESLPPDDDDLTGAEIAKELNRRRAEVKNGTVKLVPWSKLRAE
jgi:putative addiction module component (TIGR02574 family)